MSNFLFAIEGLDGCGKETQSKLLSEKLTSLGIKNKVVSFPNYNSETGKYITSFLHGDFTLPKGAVFPLYSLDRYFSYINDWKTDYDEGIVIICDRYVYSNVIYQCSHLNDLDDFELLRDFILHYEYGILGLPTPTTTYFLYAENLDLLADNMSKRYVGDESKKDIYEKDFSMLKSCMQSAKRLEFSERDFYHIPCATQKEMYPKEFISNTILENVLSYLTYNNIYGFKEKRLSELLQFHSDLKEQVRKEWEDKYAGR